MNRHLVFMNRHLVFITSKKPFNTKGYRIPKHVFKHYLNIYINSPPSKNEVLAPCKTPPYSNPHDSENHGRRSASRTLPQRKKDRTKRSERKPLSHYAYSSRSRSFVKIKSSQGDLGMDWNH